MPLDELADALVEGDIKTKRLGVIAKEESFEKLYNSVSMTVTNYENRTSKRIQLQCKRRHEQVITGDCIIDYRLCRVFQYTKARDEQVKIIQAV